jgi:hypothetical protein
LAGPSRRLPLLAGVTMVFLLIGSILGVVAQVQAAVILSSPRAQFNGEFGYSVATDGSVVVVGAPEENLSGCEYAGSAYVFNAQTGALVTTLNSPNPQPYGEFGYFVTISGNDLVVGGDGNAYVFSATTGALLATHASPNSQDSEPGYSFATSGSVVVIGAPLQNVSGDGFAGNANISKAASGALVATLTSPNLQYFGEFGYSVAASGNLIVVAAPGETVGGNSSAGHSYVFNAETGALVTTLTSPIPQYNGNFGLSVAISGNIAVVGAPGETADGDAYAGHAYIFSVASTTLESSSSTAVITRSSPANFPISGTIVVVVAVAAVGLLLRTWRTRERVTPPQPQG